jgi:hypothetical protein
MSPPCRPMPRPAATRTQLPATTHPLHHLLSSGSGVRILPGAPCPARSIPGTWFTDYSEDIVDTFSGTKGFGAGTTRPSSRSKKPRSNHRTRSNHLLRRPESAQGADSCEFVADDPTRLTQFAQPDRHCDRLGILRLTTVAAGALAMSAEDQFGSEVRRKHAKGIHSSRFATQRGRDFERGIAPRSTHDSAAGMTRGST